MAPAPPYYAGWIVTHGDPKPSMTLPTPRRAVVTTRTYGGHRITVQLYVIARAPGYVCVQQDIPGRAPWNAWIPYREATPA